MTPATAAHATALAAIHAAAFPHEPWTEASFATLLRQPGVAGFIDARGGMVLFRSVADEAEILTIGVAERRLGIGRALMQAAIAQLRDGDIAMLHLEVADTNAAALGLYNALGFTQAGRRKKYYADGADALLLSLALG